MSEATAPQLVERVTVDADQERADPELSKHDGVLEANRRARDEDLPDWQQIEGDWWEADDDLTHGARERMSDRERQVYRSVEVHGMRPSDLAEHLGCDQSTVRTLLERAREARGVQQ